MKKDDIKITKEQIKIVTDAVRSGNPYSTAFHLANIPESTFYKYKSDGDELIKKDVNPETDYDVAVVELVESIKKAEARAIDRNVALIQLAAQNHWQAAAWWLERRKPELFGKNDNLKVSGEMKHKVIILPSNDRDNE